MLPLYLSAVPTADQTSSMNLYLYNHPWIPATGSVSMIVLGPSGIKGIGDSGNITTMYTQGYGTNDGWGRSTGDMNLFIARDTEAVAGHVHLYMSQNGVTDTIDNIITGHGVASSSVSLYMHNSGVEPDSNNVRFYTHGF